MKYLLWILAAGGAYMGLSVLSIFTAGSSARSPAQRYNMAQRSVAGYERKFETGLPTKLNELVGLYQSIYALSIQLTALKKQHKDFNWASLETKVTPMLNTLEAKLGRPKTKAAV